MSHVAGCPCPDCFGVLLDRAEARIAELEEAVARLTAQRVDVDRAVTRIVEHLRAFADGLKYQDAERPAVIHEAADIVASGAWRASPDQSKGEP